jgi:hypothetical protein
MTTQDYEIVADAIRPVYSEILHDQERDFDAINAIEDTVEAPLQGLREGQPALPQGDVLPPRLWLPAE